MERKRNGIERKQTGNKGCHKVSRSSPGFPTCENSSKNSCDSCITVEKHVCGISGAKCTGTSALKVAKRRPLCKSLRDLPQVSICIELCDVCMHQALQCLCVRVRLTPKVSQMSLHMLSPSIAARHAALLLDQVSVRSPVQHQQLLTDPNGRQPSLLDLLFYLRCILL